MEKSSFFNSEIVNGEYDRVYLAEDYARYFSSFIGNGVFPNPADGLQITTDGESMTVKVKAGKAWINGYYYENDGDLILNIEPADGVLDRIDRVVLKLDLVEREISIKVKKGDFSSNPIPKNIERNVDTYEIALADIKINHGIISVSKSIITDLRLNNELCGIVHGVVEQVDTTEIFNTYQQYLNEKLTGGEFNEWFINLKNKLDPYGDIALQLQLQIQELEEKMEDSLKTDGTLQENLNADLLDGKHADEFSLSSHNHNKLDGGANQCGLYLQGSRSDLNDCAGLDKFNNVDIKSWYGISFSNSCAAGGITDKPTISMNVRNGTLYVANDVVINGQSLFQNVNSGKNTIANAIVDKGVGANGNMTFDQLANSIRNIESKKQIMSYFNSIFRFNETTSSQKVAEVLGKAFKDINPWNEITSLTTKSNPSNFSSLVINGKLYLLGGYEGSSWTASSTVKCFNMNTETWETSTSLPYTCEETSLTISNANEVFLMGRITSNTRGDRSYYTTSCKFNYSTNTYTTIASIPLYYGEDMGFANDGNTIYAGGGTKRGSIYYLYQNLHQYNTVTNTWTTIINNGYLKDNGTYRDSLRYYQNGRLYDSKGVCVCQISDKNWADNKGYPNITIPSNFKNPMNTRLDRTNNIEVDVKTKNSVKVVYAKNYNTGQTVDCSRFSSPEKNNNTAMKLSYRYIAGTQDKVFAICSITSNGYKEYHVFKLDKDLDNHLIQ